MEMLRLVLKKDARVSKVFYRKVGTELQREVAALHHCPRDQRVILLFL